MPNIVVDSGPLIALFNGSDRHHEPAKKFLRDLPNRLVTNLAVITEVTHLLDFSTEAQTDFLGWAAKGLTIDQDTATDIPEIIEVMEKNADLPADFADASLLVLCNRLDTNFIASIDSDFAVYRNRNRQPLTNVFWDSTKNG